MPGFWRSAGIVLCALALSVAARAATPDPAAALATPDARLAASWVMRQGDHGGRPFAIVDKKDARIYVFEAPGVLVGAAPVLVGLASGDREAAVLGQRHPATLAPSERTTPAGRFDSEPGRNDKGEPVVWFDYEQALAIHRLRPAPVHERRPDRLASPDPAERRISFGCIVVPVAFYEQVIMPTLGTRRGVVYVLPEAGGVQPMLRNAEVALRTP